MSNVVYKRLIRVCFKKFLKTLILEKLLLEANLQVKFQFDNLTSSPGLMKQLL